MNWVVTTKSVSQDAIEFCRTWLALFECDSLERIVLNRGKVGYGVYGWCDYIPENPRPYEIYLKVPGPFPFTVSTKEPSVKFKIYGLSKAIPDDHVISSTNVDRSEETVKVRLETKTILNSPDEGLVFLFGHELHHYLSAEDQLETEDSEYNADAYGRLLLDRYRGTQ